MSLINGALQIGRSGLSTAQAAMSVIGNNMTNAATPSYSRQRVDLVPTQYTEVSPGKYTGTGVAIADITRMVDEALNGRIRLALGDSASTLVQQQAMTRAESVFNELTEQDISTRLNRFFEAWSSLQNQPQDAASRQVVLQEGQSLVNFIREVRGNLVKIQADLDAEVRGQVAQASNLAQDIARLNEQIVVAESGRAGSAAALRDQRDDALRQLGALINITTQEVAGGAVNVFIGNDPLVQYAFSRELSYREMEGDSGQSLAQVVFADKRQAVSLTSGKIHGIITARDDQLGGVVRNLDDWARGVIYEVNQLHSLGQGLTPYTTVTAGRSVADADAALASLAGTDLPWAVSHGVFYVNITDSNGNTRQEMVQVRSGIDGNDTTLNSLAAQLDALTGITAHVNAANKLEIAAAGANYTFSFSAPAEAKNSTDVLAALGINTFFEGEDAYNIGIRAALKSDPNQLAAAANGLPSNGDVAAAIALLGSGPVASFQNRSVVEGFTALIADLAGACRTAQDNYIAADVVVQTLEAERQSISGVSVDEEAINMIIFQRAFQGAARYINLVDRMLDEMMALV